MVESFDLAGFDAERPSNNPNTISPRAICLHVIGAAHRYAHYIRKARGVDFVERYEADPARLHSPGCPRFVNRRNRVGGADRRAAAEGNRARNSGAVVRGALGCAIRPGDDPRARGLPLAASSPATGALVVIYGLEIGIRGRRKSRLRPNHQLGNTRTDSVTRPEKPYSRGCRGHALVNWRAQGACIFHNRRAPYTLFSLSPKWVPAPLFS